jgi:pimeloyl-ACP methyl ester carboxylesterase
MLPTPVPVAWSGCGGGLDCATVAVPISYQDPGGATLDLALVRHPADRPDQRIGTLLVNPGGPGASGVRRVARGFRVSPEVADRFDIVGVDPRGVGSSTPITCGAAVPAFRATDLSPDTPQEEAALRAAAQAVADECRSTEGDRLAHLGTVEVAHDVEVIRRALGEDQISFVGLSYGTLIGELWADWYPTSVRALVLDGVVDPAEGGASASLDQADAIDNVVDEMDAACAADSTCPLAATGGLLASYDELARRVEAGELSGAGVGPNQLAYAAFYATYDGATWPRLWAAVAQGLAGDLSAVADLAASYEGLVPYAPFALVTCLDGPHPMGYAAWTDSTADVALRSSRFGRALANELLPCAFWPAGTRVPGPVHAAGAPPILVIGSTGDAATPFESAVRVAHTLTSGALLKVEIEGHVALGDSDCATERATRYLVDLVVPEPGATC